MTDTETVAMTNLSVTTSQQDISIDVEMPSYDVNLDVVKGDQLWKLEKMIMVMKLILH